jgi:hypothetical protein
MMPILSITQETFLELVRLKKYSAVYEYRVLNKINIEYLTNVFILKT